MVESLETSAICIVGGEGRMGRWFGARFREAGLIPTVVDLKDWPVSGEIVASFDVVMLAVPVSAVDGVMRVIGPHIRTDAVVIDIASVKRNSINSMLKHSRGEVIGTHPLWGPSAVTFAEQVMFVCPARTGRWILPFRRFLQDRGTKVIEIEPDRHDKLMACVQTLRHILLTALGHSLNELGFDLNCDVEASGPWFQQLVNMMLHQFEQPPELYSDLAIENEYAPSTLTAFEKSFSLLTRLVSNGNRSALTGTMNQVAQFCSIHHSLASSGE